MHRVRVIVRARPTLSVEAHTSCVDMGHNTVTVVNPKNAAEKLTYQYDGCHDDMATQQGVFEREIAPLLDHLYRGENVSIFAYGMTGAGKTFTMQGHQGDAAGVIPRSVDSIIRKLQLLAASGGVAWPSENVSLTMSCMEIYNEKLYDLVDVKDQDLTIREDAQHNISVPLLAQKSLSSLADFERFYNVAVKNRSTAATSLNSHSSRSHLVVLLKLSCIDPSHPHVVFRSKLYLVDLAGSEDNRRTGNVGVRLAESGAINRSLFVLANVVDALNQKLARVPYRDSKLTRMLQDSLGGNSRSLVITNIAGSSQYYMDTYNSLNFAARARNISNRPVVSAVHLPPVQQPLPRQALDNDKMTVERRRVQLLEWRLKSLKSSDPIKPTMSTNGTLSRSTPMTLLPAIPVASPTKDGSTKRRSLDNDVATGAAPDSAFSSLDSSMASDVSVIDEANENAVPDDNDSDYVPSPVVKRPRREGSKATRKLGTSPVAQPAIDTSERFANRERDLLNVLNSGDLSAIRELQGVGKKRANLIVGYVAANGPFQQCSDLKIIGFGDKMICNLFAGSMLRNVVAI